MITHDLSQRVFQNLPFQEPVTYYHRTGGDSFTPYSVNRARKKKVDQKDSSFAAELLAVADLMWQITTDMLPVVPVSDDKLTDGGGTTWIVLAATQQLNGSVFNILTRQGV